MTELEKKFKKEMVKFERLRLESVKAQRKYDDATIVSSGLVVDKFKKNLEKALSEEAKFKESYARKIFEMLSEEKPSLLRRRDRKVIEWNEAFGADFEVLSPELQASLVALVEEKGGQYRLL